jgi:hypothetical protein
MLPSRTVAFISYSSLLSHTVTKWIANTCNQLSDLVNYWMAQGPVEEIEVIQLLKSRISHRVARFTRSKIRPYSELVELSIHLYIRFVSEQFYHFLLSTSRSPKYYFPIRLYKILLCISKLPCAFYITRPASSSSIWSSYRCFVTERCWREGDIATLF